MAEVSAEEQARVQEQINSLVERAKKASAEYLKLNQEQVDNIVKHMSMAGLEHHMELAKMAVEETGRGIYEDKITKNMFEDMHSILFEFLKASIEEAKAGYCTKLYIELLEDNQIRILDNGRGLPLVNSNEENQKIVSNILAGHPITQLDYKRMEEFKELGLQVACSLCEMLKVLVYKEDMVYMQEFVRGIAQHDIHCEGTKNRTGMEIVLLPDREIFGEICFSEEKIKQWVAEVLKEVSGLEVIICQCQ